MRTSIRKLGNSSGVIIPKSVLSEYGIAAGDAVDLMMEHGRIILVPVKGRPRAGWAEAFKEAEELTDEDRAWLDFGNDGDADLKW